MSLFKLLIFLGLFITSFYAHKVICLEGKDSKEKSEQNEDPKSDWRILGRDEKVPRGSHVQLDLTTGERRIKVLNSKDIEENEKTSVISVMKKEEEEVDSDKSENLNYRLHRIIDDDPIQSNDEKQDVKHKFKSFEELKKDFDELRLAVKTDIEIMNSILESYKELFNDKMPITEEIQDQQITMLTDLEYLLHQIDNANEFVKHGGLTNVVLPSLNSTSSEVRSASARLLGSAAQSNVDVQIAALESGAIGMLLRILASEKSPSVRSSTLYALSSIVRRFPTAQKKFVDEGGLTVLNDLFNNDAVDKLKIQVKVLTFMHDLIIEKQDAEKTFMSVTKDSNSNASAVVVKEATERLRQYNVIGLETRLQEQHWCDKLCSVLKDHVSTHLNIILNDISSKSASLVDEIIIEHDVVEKVMEAMISSSNLCLSDLENNHELQEIVSVLYMWYKKLSTSEEDSNNYYISLLLLIEKLSWRYKIKLTDNLIKDEL